MFKKIIYAVVSLLLISVISGYFYFKKKFEPPINLASVRLNSGNVSIFWESNDTSDRSALLIPVSLSNDSKTYWMQLDMGAPYSFLYGKTLNTFNVNYSASNFNLSIGKSIVSFDKIRVANYGVTSKDELHQKKLIIGTIGTDVLEKTQLLLDYKRSVINFITQIPDSLKRFPMSKFSFENRRIYLDAKINGKSISIMWDSGASAFDLITSKSQFQKLKMPNMEIHKSQGNQMGNKLDVFTSKTNQSIEIGGKMIQMNTVTYIEGFPWYVKMMFSLSGMEGMIGNNLFRDDILYLDCASEQFSIL